MDTAAFTAIVRSVLKEFPPRSYSLDTVTVEGPHASLRITPKPGFTGAPKIIAIAFSHDRNEITRAMLQAGLMQRQFDAIPETRP